MSKGHPEPMEFRFISKVRIDVANKCWLWTGALHSFGYGVLGSGQKKVQYAHRFSYEHFIGEVPSGLCVLHRCDTPACVNPKHLFLGTKKENNDDMVSKKRHRCHRGYRVGVKGVQHLPLQEGK